MVSAHPAPVEPKVRRIPSQHSEDDGEGKLGTRLKKALLRRSKALGTKPSEVLLNEAEVVMVNEIPGVPAQGCSVSSGALATASESIDMAAETAATVDNRPCQRRQAEPVPNMASKRIRTKTPTPTSQAVTLFMRGLNIQWPFSQLLVMGAKTVFVTDSELAPLYSQVRDYELDCRVIPKTDEEVWVVETKGTHIKASTNAILGRSLIAPLPSVAQIVGTVRFKGAHPYGSVEDFQNARDRHRIAVGSKFDWDGSGARYGWRVGSVRALDKPVPIGSTGPRGIGARSFSVVFATAAADVPKTTSDMLVKGKSPDGKLVYAWGDLDRGRVEVEVTPRADRAPVQEQDSEFKRAGARESTPERALRKMIVKVRRLQLRSRFEELRQLRSRFEVLSRR